MTSLDPYLKEVFPEPPLVAFKKQKNIREHLIRAKLPSKTINRPRRQNKGMKKCQRCLICPYIIEGREVKNSRFRWKIDSNVSCKSKNIVTC